MRHLQHCTWEVGRSVEDDLMRMPAHLLLMKKKYKNQLKTRKTS